MGVPDLRHLWPRSSRRGITISAALAEIIGTVVGVSWLVMGAGVWLGGEIRSARSGRCALCAVCTSLPRYLLGRPRLCRELISFAASRVWARGVGCRGVLWVALYGVVPRC